MRGARWLTAEGDPARWILSAALVLAAVPGLAAEWRITPGVSIEQAFSDNANLAVDDQDRNSDFLTTISPSVSISGRGARGTVDLAYSHSQILSMTGASGNRDQNDLAATGRAELWKQIVFVDAQASISRQILDAAAPATESVAGQAVNRTATRTFNVSPFFRHHFGTWAETESRISYNQVATQSDAVGDTSTLQERFVINSGRRFTQVLWSAAANNSKTDSGDVRPTRRSRTLDGDVTYILNRQISLIGGLGWEKIDDPTLSVQPKGLTWRAGFAARPGPRSSMRLTYGDREGTRSAEFEGNYRVSERTAITASYSETIRTSQQQIAEDLGFLAVDPVSGQIIDFRTGLPFQPGSANFGLTDNSFRQKRFSLQLRGSRQRNSFLGQVSWESRQTEATGADETVYAARLQFDRQLSNRATGGLRVSLTHTDRGTENEIEQREITLSTLYSYQLLRTARLSLAYNLTVRNVNNASGGFYENAVTAGLRKSF